MGSFNLTTEANAAANLRTETIILCDCDDTLFQMGGLEKDLLLGLVEAQALPHIEVRIHSGKYGHDENIQKSLVSEGYDGHLLDYDGETVSKDKIGSIKVVERPDLKKLIVFDDDETVRRSYELRCKAKGIECIALDPYEPDYLEVFHKALKSSQTAQAVTSKADMKPRI